MKDTLLHPPPFSKFHTILHGLNRGANQDTVERRKEAESREFRIAEENAQAEIDTLHDMLSRRRTQIQECEAEVTPSPPFFPSLLAATHLPGLAGTLTRVHTPPPSPFLLSLSCVCMQALAAQAAADKSASLERSMRRAAGNSGFSLLFF